MHSPITGKYTIQNTGPETAGFYEWPAPWSAGQYEWSIPVKWRVKSPQGQVKNLPNRLQHHEILNNSGKSIEDQILLRF